MGSSRTSSDISSSRRNESSSNECARTEEEFVRRFERWKGRLEIDGAKTCHCDFSTSSIFLLLQR